MSRLYYDDLIAGTYMAREFGVEYTLAEYEEPVCKIRFDSSIQNIGIQGPTVLYVHPDSYSIFEPMVGDKDEDGWAYNDKIEAWERLSYVDEDYGEIWNARDPKDCQTARRNNSPFFWPKKDA